MANSASASKRIRQNVKRAATNRARKSAIKSAIKKFLTACHDGDVGQAETLLSQATRRIDKVASKGALHRKTAARKKARLARVLNKTKAEKA